MTLLLSEIRAKKFYNIGPGNPGPGPFLQIFLSITYTQNNDIQHNDTHQNDTHHKDTQPKGNERQVPLC
jgi:hypothetical protein